MMPTPSPRAWLDMITWRVRGLFATEANRRIGFWARELCQPAEIRARRDLARSLAKDVPPRFRVDPAAGYLHLPTGSLPGVDDVCEMGRAVAANVRGQAGSAPNGKAFHRNELADHAHVTALLQIALDPRVVAMVT